jgi:hypothetical protein
MKLKVIYPNGVGMVDSNELDSLIASGKIFAFVRSNQLVVIGIHPTRKKESEWKEPDRRHAH